MAEQPKHVMNCELQNNSCDKNSSSDCDTMISGKSEPKCFSSRNQNLKIGFINIHYLEPKRDQLQHYILKHDFDILALAETFLNENITNNQIHINGYNFFRKDRVGRTGGGVAIYVREGINVIPVEALNSSEIEALWLKVKVPNQAPLLVCSMYRPPSANTEYYEQMLEIIDASLNISDNIIILGDLNYDYVVDESLSKNPINYIENLYSLNQLIYTPTRVTPTTSTTLDVILTSIPDDHIKTSVIKVSLSDHYMISTEVKFMKSVQKHRTITFRNYKHFNYENFISELNQELRQNFPEGADDPEFCWSAFKTSFLKISNIHAPITSRRLKNRCNPWVTKDIVSLMYSRDHYHQKGSHDKSGEDWKQYKKLRNKVTREIRKSKCKYFEEVCENFKHDGRKLWKNINLAFPFKTKTNQLTNLFTCDQINSYFTNVGKKINEQFQTNEPYEMKGPKCIYKFTLPQISNNDVLKSLSTLSSNKSSQDVLNFDSKLLHVARYIISPYLTTIFNQSIFISYVLRDFKLARVTPVYKGKGSIDDLSNYRPISVTCHISKILEAHVNSHLMFFLQTHNLITPDQSAFLKNHSTQTSLHRIVDDWLQNIDDKLITGVCSLDISKCFDSLDHQILIQKLEWHGVLDSELIWFKNYLKDRYQVTKSNGSVSKPLKVATGVPQGSVLGPLLFILYANDFSQYIKNSSCNMWADDNLLYVTGNTIHEVQTKLQETTDDANYWYKKNKLAINVPKCNIMTVSSHQKKIEKPLEISLNDVTITQVKNMKYLGLQMDENLLWNEQVAYLARTIAPKLHCFRKLRNALPSPLLSKIFKSCIQPHLDYCCSVWGFLPDSKLKKIQHIQNSAARIVKNNFDFKNIRGLELVKELGWQNFRERRDFLTSSLMFKCIHGIAPHYLSDQVVMMCDVIPYGTRSTYDMNVHLPYARTEYFKKSFQYTGGELWNQLTDNIKESPTLRKFKASYREAYFH